MHKPGGIALCSCVAVCSTDGLAFAQEFFTKICLQRLAEIPRSFIGAWVKNIAG
jgi:hypothetical protein